MGIQSRRDQVQAYRFLLRRRHASLLATDPDSVEAPLRKLGTASFAGLMVTVLCVAGAGILGVLRPGQSTAWRDGKAVVIEKETGSRFIFTQGALRPVLNYASARLLMSQAGWQTVSVSADSLAGVPRGLPVGIAGAPDELPPRSGLVSLPWSVCSLPAPDGASRDVTAAAIGGALPAGAGAGVPVPGGKALLVTRDGAPWLIWNNHRLLIDSRQGAVAQALAALYPTAAPQAVTAGWLDTVAFGGEHVAGQHTHVGQVVHATGDGQAEQWYVVATSGLTPISQVQAILLDLLPQNGGSTVEATRAEAAQKTTPGPPPNPLLPQTVPTLVNASTPGPLATCTSFTDPYGAAPGTVLVATAAPSLVPHRPAAQAAPTEAPQTPLADVTTLAPGHCALIRAVPADNGSQGTVYLVADYDGYAAKYPLADIAAQDALGYQGVMPVPVPASVAGLLHTGPRLGVADATAKVPPDAKAASTGTALTP
jgi:type VII secretion protein EccB